MRLIDRDMTVTVTYYDENQEYSQKSATIDKILSNCDIEESIPTIDAIDVIRCKDCQHSYTFNDEHLACSKWHDWQNIVDDGFCHLAERKK